MTDMADMAIVSGVDRAPMRGTGCPSGSDGCCLRAVGTRGAVAVDVPVRIEGGRNRTVSVRIEGRRDRTVSVIGPRIRITGAGQGAPIHGMWSAPGA